ncbi:MAG: T9SS type A sorting domain-containing protein [Flavobacteriales bacterium]|nr:T9SS type A sorting domain-containing protein [Flavobacteriales bacterium]
MRIQTFLTIAVAWPCTIHAQQTFERLYQSGTSYSFDLIELPGHSILTAMGATLLLDPEGYVDHASFFHEGGTYLVQTMRAAGDNEFYFTTGLNAGSCASSNTGATLIHPVLGKMDSLGSVLALKYYDLNPGICWGIPGGLEVSEDMGAITWGRERNFYAMKLDSEFEHVWLKKIEHQGGFQFIKELPGGDLLAGINMDTAGAVVARMDSDGNLLWCKSYIRPRGMVHDVVIEPDGSFLISGFTDSTASTNPFIPYPPSYHPKLFMMKLNGQGEVQWCRGYDSAPNLWYLHNASRIVKTLDGKYAVLATLGYPQNNSFFRPFLMKTDMNGDTLWIRSVGANGYDYQAQDLLAYSDGGFLFSGIVWGDMPGLNSSLNYIYKTDSLGHFTCLEKHHPLQVLDLFPADSSFVLTSVDGAATSYPVLVNDSILDPQLLLLYDACIVTNGVSTMQARKPRIYPNPTPGRFTMEFTDPLLRDSFYSVYDATGRLLYQRPLPTGATLEEVDFSRFGRGTYVLRVTDPEGQRHERVVVE